MTGNLLLFSLRGNVFSVREEDVSSVTPGGQLHRLPLSPPCVAGMTIIESRSTTIIDLGVCIGDRPQDNENRGSYLLVGSEDRKTGFWVDGSVETMPCSEERILRLPDLVRCDVVETCVLRDSAIVPIINIALLQQRISRGELSVPRPYGPSAASADSFAGEGQMRVVFLGKESFSVRSAVTTVLQGRQIHQIPYARKQTLGILYYEGEIIPVLHVAERLGLEVGETKSVLIAGEAGRRCGMAISGDGGVVDPADCLRIMMPPLVRNRAISEAIVQGGDIIPVLDLERMADDQDLGTQDQLADRYVPGSRFKDTFRKEAVELSEIALFGARHAVPQEEVVEVLPVSVVRPVPLSPSIVLGVEKKDDKLLPVLDLAAIFGKRSPIDPSWSLLRLRNGDFEALVAVEKVFGTRCVGTDVQRQVPIVLPYDVVYGCYLDEGAVRLVLNVEALTVHCEKTTIRDFMTTMSTAVEELSEERTVPAEQQIGIAASEPTETAAVSAEEWTGFPVQAGQGAPPEKPVEMPQAAASPPVKVPGEEIKQEPDRKEPDDYAALVRKVGEQEQEAARQLLAQERLTEEAERAAFKDRQRREQIGKTGPEEGRSRSEADVQPHAEPSEIARAEAARQRVEDRIQAEREKQQEKDRHDREAEALRLWKEQRKKETEMEDRTDSPVAPDGRIVPDTPVLEQRPSTDDRAVPPEVRGTSMNLGRGMIAAAVIALIVFAFFGIKKGVKTPVPGQQDERLVVSEKNADQREKKTEKPEEAPLVLVVPKAVPVANGTIYTVVKGDTLWGIAKRFTGNPLNYPRLARDNSIATPDLIFPGQKIRMKKE